MASIPVMCMICSKSVKEDQFVRHMETAHGTASQSEAMAREGNIPKQAPVVLDKEAAPSSDFMEVAAMLDATPPVPEKVKQVVQETQRPAPVAEPKRLVLRYKWEGECKECSTQIRTVVVKAKGQTVVVALCLMHGEIQQREVADLEQDVQEDKTVSDLQAETKEVMDIINYSSVGKEKTLEGKPLKSGKEVKKYAK